MLHFGFGVPAENIEVADLELHPALSRTDFKVHQFSMFSEWPQFGRPFKYILFPESLGVAISPFKAEFFNKHRYCSVITHRFHNDLECVEKAFFSGTLKDVRQEDIRQMLQVIEMDLPWMPHVLNMLKSALANLESGGQIRLNGHLLPTQSIAYLGIMLLEHNPQVGIELGDVNPLIISK